MELAEVPQPREGRARASTINRVGTINQVRSGELGRVRVSQAGIRAHIPGSGLSTGRGQDRTS